MTDVLLAHAFFLHNDPKQVAKMRPYPPLGTLYAAALLRQHGYAVAVFDAMLAGGLADFEALLDRHQPAVVALYEDQFNFLMKMCLGHVRSAACRMAELARARGATVIAAGSDVSDHPEVYFAHGVAYALTGEADRSLVSLVDVLTGREPGSLDAIPGLAVPAAGLDGRPRRNPRGEPERHLDGFPFPAWDLIDLEPYRAAWRQAHGYFSLNMVTTRGCPFHCNWCAKPIWGQRYAMRSPDNVAEEMALLKVRYRPDHLWFADDIFGLQPRWVHEFARAVEARDAAVPFMIQTRADLMTDKAVEGLARAGCAEVWLGAESGSQKVLDAMEKGTKLPQLRLARARLRQAGIRACFFLQFGYPGETLEDVRATVELVRDALPDDIGVSVSYPLPGTKFHALVREELVQKDHWEDSNELAMMFQGTYQSAFYRKLHELMHRDLELRHRLRAGPPPGTDLFGDLDRLTAAWFELGQMEPRCRSSNPTTIRTPDGPAEVPDLSKRWN
jgi:anaerobic magnesium-protoporphyrin IX monomethyl ester cyclase